MGWAASVANGVIVRSVVQGFLRSSRRTQDPNAIEHHPTPVVFWKLCAIILQRLQDERERLAILSGGLIGAKKTTL